MATTLKTIDDGKVPVLDEDLSGVSESDKAIVHAVQAAGVTTAYSKISRTPARTLSSLSCSFSLHLACVRPNIGTAAYTKNFWSFLGVSDSNAFWSVDGEFECTAPSSTSCKISGYLRVYPVNENKTTSSLPKTMRYFEKTYQNLDPSILTGLENVDADGTTKSWAECSKIAFRLCSGSKSYEIVVANKATTDYQDEAIDFGALAFMILAFSFMRKDTHRKISVSAPTGTSLSICHVNNYNFKPLLAGDFLVLNPDVDYMDRGIAGLFNYLLRIAPPEGYEVEKVTCFGSSRTVTIVDSKTGLCQCQFFPTIVPRVVYPPEHPEWDIHVALKEKSVQNKELWWTNDFWKF